MKKIWITITLLLLVAIVSLQICHALGLLNPNGKQIVCPVNAIKMHKGKAIIDENKCIGCTRCVNGFYAVNNKEEIVASSTDADESDAAESSETESSLSANSLSDTSLSSTSLSDTKAIPADKKTNSADKKTNSAKTKPTPKNYHKVNTEECIGCGLCVKDCPTKAISMKNGKAIIDKNKCINCGICRGINEDVFAGCPVDAIVAVKDSL